jgi:hypothetical protein
VDCVEYVHGKSIWPETCIYWISAFYCWQYLSSRLSYSQTCADLVRCETGESSLFRCRALSLVSTDVSKTVYLHLGSQVVEEEHLTLNAKAVRSFETSGTCLPTKESEILISRDSNLTAPSPWEPQISHYKVSSKTWMQGQCYSGASGAADRGKQNPREWKINILNENIFSAFKTLKISGTKRKEKKRNEREERKRKEKEINKEWWLF